MARAIVPTVLSLCALFAPAFADESGSVVFDPDRIVSFFDEYLPVRMAENHIAGAAVSVVHNGRTIMSKGYGYADVDRNIPVDPDATVFILGSLSKVFTWTAVMQLVERGKIDLDADVNDYLDFTIPASFGKPVAMKDLMSHSAGFEDNKFDQMTGGAGTLIPLKDWLPAHVPARVRPAGEYGAYGNYAAALAGYIVERVSGMSYDDYMERNILRPLEMSHATSRQREPEASTAYVSPCYTYADGKFRSQELLSRVALHVAPAGSFKASASDMAAFMRAHLDGETAAVLNPETRQLMRTRSFSHDPRVNGMAHGFWELDMNGVRIIGHAGSHFIENSVLLLFPEHGLGVFVATNSLGGASFLGENFLVFEKAFVDRFFPAERSSDAPVPTARTDSERDLERYAGSYGMTYGRSYTTPEKLFGLMMSVAVRSSGSALSVTMPMGNLSFVETEPLVFRQTDDGTPLVFRENADGAIESAFYGSIPLTALVRSEWYETPGFNLPLLGICLLLFLSFLIVTPIAFLLGRKRVAGVPAAATTVERLSGPTAMLSSFSCLFVILGAFASVFDAYGLYTGNLPLWPFVRVVSIAVVPLAAASIVFAVLSWIGRFRSLPGRIHYTLTALASIGFVWFMWFWNILGKGF